MNIQDAISKKVEQLKNERAIASQKMSEYDEEENNRMSDYYFNVVNKIDYTLDRITEILSMVDNEIKVGDKVKILSMQGEPTYYGRTGIVKRIDAIGQLHGTWGGLALIPGEDSFEKVED